MGVGTFLLYQKKGALPLSTPAGLTTFPTTGIASIDLPELIAGFFNCCMAAGKIPQVFKVFFFRHTMASFFMYFIFMEDAFFSINIVGFHFVGFLLNNGHKEMSVSFRILKSQDLCHEAEADHGNVMVIINVIIIHSLIELNE